jgi:hypothetical protein
LSNASVWPSFASQCSDSDVFYVSFDLMNRDDSVLEWLRNLEDGGQQTTLAGGGRFVSAAEQAGHVTDDAISLDSFAATLDRLRLDGAIAFRDQHSDHRPRYGPLLGSDLSSCREFRVTVAGRQETQVAKPTVSIRDSVIGQFAVGDINNLTLVSLIEDVEAAVEASTASDDDKREARDALGRARKAVDEIGSSAAGDLVASALRAVLGVG